MYSACSLVSVVSRTPRCGRCSRADLFIEVLRQHVDLLLVRVIVQVQLELREHLVGERGRHDEARMARRAAQVQQAPLGQHHHAVAVREAPLVVLGLMLIRWMPGIFFSPAMSISLSKWPMFPTIALSFIFAMCAP